MISFRLPEGEREDLQEAVKNSDESLSDFIRNAIALRLGVGAIVVSAGAPGSEVTVTLHSHSVAGYQIQTVSPTYRQTGFEKENPNTTVEATT